MNLRTIPRIAVTGSIALARLPVDALVAVFPGDRTGIQGAVDRTDATARILAGTFLGDAALREDGSRRHAAAAERGRAEALRDQAADLAGAADEQLKQRQRAAQKQRRRADERAHEHSQQAAQRRQQRSRRAGEEEQRRRGASRRAEVQVAERIEAAAPAARLEALDEQAAAQREREQALVESDEARRLEAAAERAKEEGKEDS